MQLPPFDFSRLFVTAAHDRGTIGNEFLPATCLDPDITKASLDSEKRRGKQVDGLISILTTQTLKLRNSNTFTQCLYTFV